MANKPPSDTTFTRTVLRLLTGLRRTGAGDAIYRHIATLLADHSTNQLDIERAYASLLDMLLRAFIERVPRGSPLQIQLKLILLHLAPPLSLAELTTLHNCLQIYKEELAKQKKLDEDLMEKALTPLLEEYSKEKSPIAPVKNTALSPPKTPATHSPMPMQVAATTVTKKPNTDGIMPAVEHHDAPRAAAVTDHRVDATYRQHLNEKRQGIQRIQAKLAQQITGTIRQNEEFGVLLEVEQEALRQASSIQELGVLRKTLMTEVEKLQHAHKSLTSRLQDTHKYLQAVETDSQQLSDELTRVHLLSLTDELTDLPNRRAFMRRLEDEVGRVQRYGNKLSLVLIDIDSFKLINDDYGHAVGDDVLRTYAKNILSIFRHHDLVSRYGGEEFAVLLPNTDSEGAISSVDKVQRRAAECSYEFENTPIKMPTFSAGVALYLPGETPTDLIERADSALNRAKQLGRNRSELATNEKSDAALR